jgi:Family of unknown function (DUF6194)
MIAISLPGVDAETATQASGAPEVAWPGWNEASDLNRDGVFRLNLGVAKATLDDCFPTGAVVDYTALDTLPPHPVYAKNHWVYVLNPSAPGVFAWGLRGSTPLAPLSCDQRSAATNAWVAEVVTRCIRSKYRQTLQGPRQAGGSPQARLSDATSSETDSG